MDPLTFAQGLLPRGMELALRKNGRLYLWPHQAWHYLTTDERTYIREHRQELKELVASRVLPETTVTWQPPGVEPPPSDAGLSVQATEPTSAPAPPPACPYCGRACVGPNHVAYPTLHHNDPTEITRRDREATAVMLRATGH